MTTGATVNVQLGNMITTSDNRLAMSSASGPGAQVTLTGSQSMEDAPELYLAEITLPIASSMGAFLSFKTTSQAAGSGTVEIEVWLVGREA